MFSIVAELKRITFLNKYSFNIANQDYLIKFLDTLIKSKNLTEASPLAKWIKSNLRNYLINKYEDGLTEITSYDQSRHEPWVKKSLDAGTKIYNLDIPKDFEDELKHVLDYLIGQDLTDYNRVSVDDAIRKTKEWDKTLQSKRHQRKMMKKLTDIEGEETVYESDNLSFKKLTSKEAFEKEGSLMMHCVGRFGYFEKFQKGDVEIYSGRDSSNNPIVTIEYQPKSKTIEQIKGKQNSEVPEQYQNDVIEFINEYLKDYNKIDDLDYINAIELGDKLYNESNIPTELKNDYLVLHGDIGDAKIAEMIPSINSEKTLAKVFRKSYDKTIREACLAKIKNPHLLYSLLGYNFNEAILNKLTKEDLIKEISLDYESSAAEYINKKYPDAWEEIYKTTKEDAVKEKAVSYIKDPSFLLDVIKNDPSSYIRMRTVRVLRHILGKENISKYEKEIQGIYAKENDAQVKEELIFCIFDIDLLKQIASKDKNSSVRELALKQIREAHNKEGAHDDFFIERSEKDKKGQTQTEAVKHIKDQKKLLNLFLNSKSKGIPYTAFHQLTDPNLLYEAYEKIKNDEEKEHYKYDIIKKLPRTDKHLLDIAINDTDKDVALLAAQTYDSEGNLRSKLLELWEKAKHSNVKHYAMVELKRYYPAVYKEFIAETSKDDSLVAKEEELSKNEPERILDLEEIYLLAKQKKITPDTLENAHNKLIQLFGKGCQNKRDWEGRRSAKFNDSEPKTLLSQIPKKTFFSTYIPTFMADSGGMYHTYGTYVNDRTLKLFKILISYSYYKKPMPTNILDLFWHHNPSFAKCHNEDMYRDKYPVYGDDSQEDQEAA